MIKYGLLGKKLPHSLSPYIHSLLGNKDYSLIEIEENELQDFFQKKEFNGINVTIPYKETVLKYLDYVDEKAKAIGCVNTIINKNNKLYGYNTDYYGFKSLIEKLSINIYNKKVLILGTGATSKTIEVVLNDFGVKEVLKMSRHPLENQVSYNDISKVKNFQILINSTPIGMYPNNEYEIIDISNFNSLEGIIDVIYNPLNTRLILQGKNHQIPSLGGLDMLINQAIYADKLFFNRNKTKHLDTSLIYMHLINIVLIGLPGVGKSSLSLKLSKKLNKKLIDIDKIIEKENGISISDIFKNNGENYFRNEEERITKQYSQEFNQIISTGGGIIKRNNNMLNLMQNGIIIYVKRDLSLIKLNDKRPLTKNYEDLLKLEEERNILYNKYKHITIYNNSDLDECADYIIKQIWSLLR